MPLQQSFRKRFRWRDFGGDKRVSAISLDLKKSLEEH